MIDFDFSFHYVKYYLWLLEEATFFTFTLSILIVYKCIVSKNTFGSFPTEFDLINIQ